MPIKKINIGGSTFSTQPASNALVSTAQASTLGKGTRSTVLNGQTSVLTYTDKYSSSNVQSSLDLRSKVDTSQGSGRLSSGKMKDFSSLIEDSSGPMSSVLGAGGMSALYDQKRLEYASTGRATAQAASSDIQTVSMPTSAVSSTSSTIYQDLLSSNILMNRGFDPTRASIVGSFEFIPLSDHAESSDEILLYDAVPTTCLLLVDMQSIAQQTRLLSAVSSILFAGETTSDISAQGPARIVGDLSDHGMEVL